jgi:hypothetical protein
VNWCVNGHFFEDVYYTLRPDGIHLSDLSVPLQFLGTGALNKELVFSEAKDIDPIIPYEKLNPFLEWMKNPFPSERPVENREIHYRFAVMMWKYCIRHCSHGIVGFSRFECSIKKSDPWLNDQSAYIESSHHDLVTYQFPDAIIPTLYNQLWDSQHQTQHQTQHQIQHQIPRVDGSSPDLTFSIEVQHRIKVCIPELL